MKQTWGFVSVGLRSQPSTLLTQCVYTVAQSQQTSVDVSPFYHSLAAVLSVGGAFRPGEVDKVEFADTDLLSDTSETLTLFDGDNEDSVRPR